MYNTQFSVLREVHQSFNFNMGKVLAGDLDTTQRLSPDESRKGKARG